MPRCPTCHRRLHAGRPCPGDGGVAPAAEPLLDAGGVVVPGYRIDRCLGVGGFAVVWAGYRDSDGKPVALKVAHDPGELAARRLVLEAETLTLIGPPHVPRCYGTGRLPDGRMFLAMELIEGSTLAASLESLPGLPDLAWVQRMSDGILSLLQAVHEKGVVHRDIKPENIILTAESPLERQPLGAPGFRLVDFGLTMPAAQHPDPARDTGGSHPAAVVGTVEYMAPEQLVPDATVDARSDIYAFGALCYELFTLRPPFVGDRASVEHGHLSLRPPWPRHLAPVPEAVERLILQCLAKNPDKRPQDIPAVRRDLARAFSGAGPRARASISEVKSSLLVDRRQPVVLAAVFADAPPVELAETMKRYGGFLARQRGALCLCAFSGLVVDDPFAAALAAVRAVVNRFAARVVLHIAQLAIRRKRRGPPAVIGQEVDKPETWVPGDEWSGILVTDALAQARLGDVLEPAPGHHGFFVIAGARRAEITLVGRAEIMSRIAASLRASMDTATPGLCTVLGDTGLGKTRLAHELAALARARYPEARIISLRATIAGTPEQDAAARELTAVLDDMGVALGSSSAGTRRVASAPREPVVIILDDAQRAGSEILSQLEYATLDHPDTPLWVLLLAHPYLDTIRGQWGARANRHERMVLAALEPDAAMALAAELLLPAEYPPAEFLRRLAQWAHGNPQLLTGLVAELKQRGVVRRREQGEGWDVSTAELEELPAAPAGLWLATRLLDEIPPELAACVRMCSVLGPTFTAGELAWMQDTMEQYGGAGTTVDAEIGLAELVEMGVLEQAGSGAQGQLAFTTPALQDAVYKLLEAQDREQIHTYAAEYWGARLGGYLTRPKTAAGDAAGPDVHALRHFARHAGACGRVDEATRAWVRLGDAARHTYNYVEADSHYTAAIRLDGRDLRLRARAFAGRGKVRHRIHRIQEAFEDLAAARQLAGEIGDRAGVIDLWLEEATAADAAADWERSASCADKARALLADLAGAPREPELLARSTMAMGRTCWRQGRASEAIPLLSEAARSAALFGDHETEIVADLLLGCALVHEGQHHRAEPVFDRVLERCVQTADRLHECRAYGNRMYLWRKQPERAMDDLRRAMQLAREVGNPEPERVATHNLAELLYWSGDSDEAIALARRSRVLQQRFWNQVPHDTLLMARIHATREEYAAVREMVRWIDRECDLDNADPSVQSLYQMIKLVLDELSPDGTPGATVGWDELVARAEVALPTEELIEVLWWRARAAIAGEQWPQAAHALRQAGTRLHESPIWRHRIDTLVQLLP